jgi:hypothetical protein
MTQLTTLELEDALGRIAAAPHDGGVLYLISAAGTRLNVTGAPPA